jgi:PST family polysaccharide transporter
MTRSLIIKNGGPAANGLYQVAFALVSYYTPFFTNGVWGYLFPKLSAIRDVDEFNVEINKALRFIVLFLTPSIISLFLLRKPLVLLIFSKEFLGSLEIFPLYLLGSFFFLVSYILGTAFLASKKLKAYLSISIAQNVLYVAIFAMLVERLGLLAIAISYCAVNLLASMASILFQVYRMDLKLNTQNIKLFILSISFILLVFFSPLGKSLFVLSWTLVAAWMLFAVGKREKALLFSFIRSRP